MGEKLIFRVLPRKIMNTDAIPKWKILPTKEKRRLVLFMR